MSDILQWRFSFKSMLSSMQAHDSAGKKERDRRINENVMQFLSTRNGLWLCFSGGDLEPLMNLKFSGALKSSTDAVQLAFPVLDVLNSKYVYYYATTSDPRFKNDHHFTYEPDLSDPSWKAIELNSNSKAASSGEPVLQGALIPGLGFDRAFYRLGRGSRFYERAVNDLAIEKVGVCYAEQLVEAVPGDDEDLQMDAIITDKEIYRKS